MRISPRLLHYWGINDESERFQRKAAELDPYNYIFTKDLALQLLTRKEYPEAESAFIEAAKIFPSASAWLDLGHFYAETKEWKKALEYYRKALELQPGDMEITRFIKVIEETIRILNDQNPPPDKTKVNLM
jgi:tetratricopeptide (TPR) repeat protein